MSSRTIVYAAIGAPCTASSCRSRFRSPERPPSACVRRSRSSRSSAAFGPVVGLFTGLVGNMIGDQLSGWGLLTSWNWSIANGLVGLLAGLTPMFLASMTAKGLMSQAIAGAIGGVGRRRRRLPVRLHGRDQGPDGCQRRDGEEYIPVIIADLIATIILVPVLLYAWEPVKARLGR